MASRLHPPSPCSNSMMGASGSEASETQRPNISTLPWSARSSAVATSKLDLPIPASPVTTTNPQRRPLRPTNAAIESHESSHPT